MFFKLMVGTPRPLAPPPRGAQSIFFVLMVGAPGPPAPPPKGPTIDIMQLSDSRSQTSNNASKGHSMSRTFFQ
jgi:hypothetical protein